MSDLRAEVTAAVAAMRAASPLVHGATGSVTRAIVADGLPPVPQALADATRPYLESRAAGFAGWNPVTRGLLIATRFGRAELRHRDHHVLSSARSTSELARARGLERREPRARDRERARACALARAIASDPAPVALPIERRVSPGRTT